MGNAEKLIEAVRARPYLYNPSLHTSKLPGVRTRNWMEVAKMVYGRTNAATVNKVKIQWKSLRDAFVKQQRKRKSAVGKIRPYLYEEEMMFLHPFILTKDRDECASEGDAVPVSNFDVKTEDCNSFSGSLSGDSPHDRDAAESAGPPAMEEFLWDQNPQLRVLGDKDGHPVDAFFHGIAQTVKQLRPATVAKLKKTVANIVMDAELAELEANGNY